MCWVNSRFSSSFGGSFVLVFGEENKTSNVSEDERLILMYFDW